MAFYITEDIISDILLRLPAKDLNRFKIVCKLWYSLISDSNFQKVHFDRSIAHQQNIILTILKNNSETLQKELRDNRGRNYHKGYEILDQKYLSINMQDKNMIKVEDFYLNSPIIHWKLSVLATCNGLLLVLDEYGMLYVYNAVTHQYWVVPYPANYYCNDGHRCSNWGLGSHDWTLFYDDSVGKYKLCGIGSGKCIFITVGEDWNEVVISGKYHRLSPPIYLDKEIHWLVYEGHGDHWENFVLSMEVATNLIRKIKAPVLQCRGYNNYHCILSVVKGSLCLVSALSDQIDIFVLEDRVDSMWTKYYSTSLQALRNIPTSLTSFVSNISNNVCLVAMRDIEGYDFSDLVKVFVRHEGKLIYYDLKREESKEIATLSGEERLREFYHCYSGSIVSW